MARKKQECPECDEVPIWITTFGDLNTLLLSFFVMIFSVGKDIPKEVQLILSAFSDSLGFFEGGQTLEKGRLEQMGMNLETLPSQVTGRSLARAKAQALSIFKPEIQAKKVRVQEDERGLIISLIGADYFEPGSAQLTPALEDVLKKVSYLLKQLNRYTRIEGHSGTKEVETGSPYPNEREYINSWDLAAARSIQVTMFLQNLGVEPSFMQALSYGSYRPLDMEGDTKTPEGEAHNRRIDIVVLPFKEPLKNKFENTPKTTPSIENLIPDT
ncbi:MAG: OmpA family protein [Leptonema sp. (in: bacteria)]